VYIQYVCAFSMCVHSVCVYIQHVFTFSICVHSVCVYNLMYHECVQFTVPLLDILNKCADHIHLIQEIVFEILDWIQRTHFRHY
jgi:hypothetical protein